jgi:transposase
MPHALRRVDLGQAAMAELEVLVGFDDDLAIESTRLITRIRGLLASIHPALERVLGPRVTQAGVLALLIAYGGPLGLRTAGRRRLIATATKASARFDTAIVDHILGALAEQTVTVPGTEAAQQVLPRLARSLAEVLDQRKAIGAQVEKALDAHPLGEVLTSMPGVGVRTAARILLEVGDASSFPTSAHLAAYAGLAPVTVRSGSSIRGEHPNRGGNKQLKRAMFLSAFAALKDPTSRAYYDRKRAQGRNTTPP